MPRVSELVHLSAGAMAAAVAAGEVSATDLVDAHLARIAAVDHALRAFVDLRDDAARREARAQDEAAARGQARGSLGGVPITVKSAIAVAGLRCETGSPSRAGQRAAADAVSVARLRAAGAIVLGTTNVAEMLMGYETTNPLHGTTNNPWDLTRTPGGSSGGESAAIAAGCSAAGLGSDGGGSIRVPAHFTGICGLKPTPGRVPGTGHQPACLGPFSLLGVVGPMARTIDDLAALYTVLAGWDPDDPCATTLPVGRLGDAPLPEVWWFDSYPPAPASGETRQAVARAAAALADAGVRVRPGCPVSLGPATTVWTTFFGDIGELLLTGALGPSARALPILAAVHQERGPRSLLTAADVAAAWIARDEVRAAVLHQLGGRLLLCPVTSMPAFRHGERAWQVDGTPVGYLDAMSFTPWANILGLPAAVVPAGRSAEGLPIGVQIIGPPFADMAVLAAARVIERAGGEWTPPPPIFT